MELLIFLVFIGLALNSLSNSQKERAREEMKLWVAQTNAILGWEKYELRKKHSWSLHEDVIIEWDDSCRPAERR